MNITRSISILAGGGILALAAPLSAQTTTPITTNDGLSGVSGFVQQDDTGGFGGTQWHVKNAATTTTRKGYVRFDLSGITGVVTDADFELVVSLIQDIIGDIDQVVNVYGITDEALDSWDPATTTWNTAPANNTNSKFEADLTAADLLGTIAVDFNGDKASPVGTVVGLNNQALIDFLNADTNGLVTFILGRAPNAQDGANLLFSGDTNDSLAPPTLTVTTVPDTFPPVLSSLSPADDTLETPLDAELVASFDEPVMAGTGIINLHLASDDSVVESFDVATSGQIDFTDSVLTITPGSALTAGTEYYVLIPDTAVQDAAGNAFAGITDPTAWSFTGDAIPPSITGLSPADDSPAIDSGTNLVATFSEDIFAVSGNIQLKDLTNSTTLLIDIFDPQVTISGDTLAINPDADLLGGTDYAIQIASGVLEDSAGNAFPGITDDLTWNFTTAPIVVVNSSAERVPDTGGLGDPFDLENVPYTVSFDAGADADKLVLSLATETGSGAPPVITYDGNPLEKVPNTGPGGRNRGFYYLDLAGTGYAGGPADLTFDMTSYGTVNGIGYAVVSIAGSVPGYALTASEAESQSVTLTPPVDGSFVMVNYGANGGGTVDVDPALVALYGGDVGSAMGGSGYENGATATARTYTFIDGAPGNPGTSAVVFLPFSGAPALVATDPADDGQNVSSGANLTATFSEDVVAGTGTIELWQVGGGSPVESFDVASSTRVTFSGNTLTIDPSSNLPAAELEYYVLISAGAVVDTTGGDAFAGISDPTAWSFTTFGPPAADNDRISILTASLAGEALTSSDLVHAFDTFPRVSTTHTLISAREIAMDAGHHLVIYNTRFDEPDDADGSRSEIQTNLNLDGTNVPAGWSQAYIRRFSPQYEAICAGGAIIDVASGGDILQLQSFTSGTASEDVIREPGQTALQLVKLDDSWDYLRLAGHDGLGTDQVLGAGENTVAYTDELEKDAGSFGDTSDGVTLVQAGHYLVFANTYVVGDNAGSGKRTTVTQQLTLDGSAVPGSKTTAYLRGADGEDEGAATIGMIIETTTANQVLRTLVSRENEAVGVLIDGDRSSITIAKLPDTADYIRLTDTEFGQDFNGGSALIYDTQEELDGAFTHDTGTNADQVGVTAADDYLFFASQYDASGLIERVYYNQGWQINGSGGLAVHGQTGGYNRAAADTAGDASVVGNWSGFVTALAASDYVQTVTQALGAPGSEVADDFALQGVRLSSLFGGTPPATAYDTWALGNGLAGADAAIGADTENGGGDGLVQILEFAFGTDPNAYDNVSLAANGSVLGTPVLAPAAGGGFELLFVRREDHGTSGSVTYTPQFSDGDLGTFHDDSTMPTVVFDGAGYDIVSVPFPASLPGGLPARFGRVQVTLEP